MEIGLLAAFVGIALGYGGHQVLAKRRGQDAATQADKVRQDAENESKRIILEAKDKALRTAEEAKRDEQRRRAEIAKAENRVADREVNLDRKLEELDQRAEKLRKGED
ncbi:ribonuclease Y, partial [Candidatus Saccharibacteria bacterium]